MKFQKTNSEKILGFKVPIELEKLVENKEKKKLSKRILILILKFTLKKLSLALVWMM